MIRATILTLALAIASMAASGQAGGFQIKIGGHSGGHKNFQSFGHKQSSHVHQPKVYVTCYYKVCYSQPGWGYTRYKIFNHLGDAKHFAHDLESHGLHASISKVHSRY